MIQDAASESMPCKQDHLVAYGLASGLFNATLATKEVEGEEQEMLHRLKVLFFFIPLMSMSLKYEPSSEPLHISAK